MHVPYFTGRAMKARYFASRQILGGALVLIEWRERANTYNLTAHARAHGTHVRLLSRTVTFNLASITKYLLEFLESQSELQLDTTLNLRLTEYTLVCGGNWVADGRGGPSLTLLVGDHTGLHALDTRMPTFSIGVRHAASCNREEMYAVCGKEEEKFREAAAGGAALLPLGVMKGWRSRLE